MKRNVTENENLIWEMLEIGKAMVLTGAEIWRVDDSLHRLLEAYGFSDINVWVISTNIQLTAKDQSGNIYSQNRDVRNVTYDLNRLDRLNDLSRYACANTPDSDELKTRLSEILSMPGPSKVLRYIATAFSIACLTIYFNGDLADAMVGFIVGLVMVWLGDLIGRHEGNPIVYNVFVSFCLEVLIILSVLGGIGHNVNTITIAIIMMLIGALGLTNGILDLFERNTLSGVIGTINSLLAASGVAVGITLAMLLFRKTLSDMMIANAIHTIRPTDVLSNIYLQLFFGTVGCVGFALLFGIKGRKVAYSGLGALASRLVYVLTLNYLGESIFIATLAAAAFVAAYALIMARVNKTPRTLFLTVGIFPVIPGSYLYFMVYYAIMHQMDKMVENGNSLLLVLLGITFGYIVVEFITKYMSIIIRKSKQIFSEQVHLDE